jgi:hypothetical protein
MKTFFDPIAHQYFIDDRPVPSVTQVLDAILGDAMWHASEWHMERGRAVHMAAAFIAQGKQFVHDPAIDGQVWACQKFFADMKPEVLEVENPLYSESYNFAGTPDLICVINGKKCIVDFKASLTDVVFLQLGGYAVLYGIISYGMGVELKDDGNYKATPIVKTDRYRNEFLACLSVYGIRQRLGLIGDNAK